MLELLAFFVLSGMARDLREPWVLSAQSILSFLAAVLELHEFLAEILGFGWHFS